MDAPAQQTLADYITGGGNAVIYPYMPDRELSQKKCTLLRDALKVSPSGTARSLIHRLQISSVTVISSAAIRS